MDILEKIYNDFIDDPKNNGIIYYLKKINVNRKTCKYGIQTHIIENLSKEESLEVIKKCFEDDGFIHFELTTGEKIKKLKN